MRIIRSALHCLALAMAILPLASSARAQVTVMTQPGVIILPANQNSATKLRNQFTLDQLVAEFGLDDDEEADVR